MTLLAQASDGALGGEAYAQDREGRLGYLWVPEESGMDMPGTNARLEPPCMATNKSSGGPWGWDVTPQGKRGRVDAASK